MKIAKVKRGKVNILHLSGKMTIGEGEVTGLAGLNVKREPSVFTTYRAHIRGWSGQNASKIRTYGVPYRICIAKSKIDRTAEVSKIRTCAS